MQQTYTTRVYWLYRNGGGKRFPAEGCVNASYTEEAKKSHPNNLIQIDADPEMKLLISVLYCSYVAPQS